MLAEVFKANGYHTVHLGKWHLSGGAAPCHFVAPCFRPGWDTWIGWENSNRPFNTQYAEGNYPIPMKTLPGYQTDALTDIAIDQLNGMGKEEPFFMVVSVEPPHDPHVVPESYQKEYEKRRIRFRKNVPDSWKTPENIAEAKGYFAQIKNLDDNIGRLIKTLKTNGQYENTMIFYFSDHGDFMGSHNRVQKFYAEEESSKIPFIIRYPGKKIPPCTCSELISSIDIPTTALGLAGLDIPKTMYGTDFSEQILEQKVTGKEEVLIELNSWFDDNDPEYGYRALRTKKYLIIKARKEKNCCLYDMEKDPYQMRNLYRENEYASIRDNLVSRLRRKLDEIGDDYYDRFLSDVQ
jgi:arylsulfatase A-like enzyme